LFSTAKPERLREMKSTGCSSFQLLWLQVTLYLLQSASGGCSTLPRSPALFYCFMLFLLLQPCPRDSTLSGIPPNLWILPIISSQSAPAGVMWYSRTNRIIGIYGFGNILGRMLKQELSMPGTIRGKLYASLLFLDLICAVFYAVQTFVINHDAFHTLYCRLAYIFVICVCGISLWADLTLTIATFVPAIFTTMFWLKKCW